MSLYESEQAICRQLGDIGRALHTREQVKTFVARYGIPWWVEPDDELLRLCPIRLRPRNERDLEQRERRRDELALLR